MTDDAPKVPATLAEALAAAPLDPNEVQRAEDLRIHYANLRMAEGIVPLVAVALEGEEVAATPSNVADVLFYCLNAVVVAAPTEEDKRLILTTMKQSAMRALRVLDGNKSKLVGLDGEILRAK